MKDATEDELQGRARPSDRDVLLLPRARSVDPHAYREEARQPRRPSVLDVLGGVATGALIAVALPDHGALVAWAAAGVVAVVLAADGVIHLRRRTAALPRGPRRDER